MAITIPVYTNCLRQNVGDPGGTSEHPGTALKIRHSGEAAIGGADDAAVEAASPGVARGLIVGVRATSGTGGGSAAGTVTIRVYSDVSKTDELYSVGLDLSSSPFKSSDMLAQGIPFFAPPYFTIQCSVDPNATVFVTFYIKSIAGNG